MREMRDNTRGGEQRIDISSVGVAAHELKSPLVLMRQLSLELARGDGSGPEQQRIIAQLIHTSEKAIRLTGDLTRVENIQQSALFELEPISLLQVCDEVAGEIGQLYQAHGRVLRRTRRHMVPPIVGNRDLLRRILLNFADNALHYGGEEGEVELHAKLDRRKQKVRVAVRDYGPALSNDNWKKLVASFGSTQTLHARPQSSGLGLYIAHNFAASMGGKIGAIRHRDGASFYVELPISHQLSLL